jgi:hypothetical protein
LDRLCGGKTERERRAALREYTEAPVRQGTIERPWDRLVAGLAMTRFTKRLEQTTQLRRQLVKIENQLSHVDTNLFFRNWQRTPVSAVATDDLHSRGCGMAIVNA